MMSASVMRYPLHRARADAELLGELVQTWAPTRRYSGPASSEKFMPKK
jgi:hypothetical protein